MGESDQVWSQKKRSQWIADCFVALAGVVTGLSCGTGKIHLGNGEEPCSASADCGTGETCYLSVCFPSCTTERDCPLRTQDCSPEGLCMSDDLPECYQDSDCATPPPCATASGVICSGGTCTYAAAVCDAPPASECLASNSFRAYGAAGTCDPTTDLCIYPPTDTDCSDTTSCTINGTCVPGPPAACQWTAAADGTVCTPSAGPVDGGRCVDAACIALANLPCSANTDCAPDTCVAQACLPPGGTSATCDAGDDADCAAGHVCSNTVCLKQDGEACSSNGDCANICVALLCDAAGAAGASCDAGEDADCDTDFVCQNGTCTGLAGVPCTINGDCTETCIGGVCWPFAAAGGPCDLYDNSDCRVNTVCDVAICRKIDGETCGGNGGCLNTCIAGLCGPRSPSLGPCDINDTNDCEAGLTCSSGVCQP